ncbi:phage terminase small subunit P27 family [Bacillus subtilis]|uniref:phage terminase small subunit P27 family n=1 Tax=Bacillus subtilis TaxID=1423 RepID=UPI0011CBF211|nr:phage terminase small subunit P27 family [Bacillus subtilis]MCY9334112.1 phage terminase small subunit P27 family [Bacillus spizizenii]TXK63720.1 phage terminase small subunit P27 family [Bacillus subtilis]
MKGGYLPMERKKTFERIKRYLGESYQESDDELIHIYCDTYEFYCRLRDEVSKAKLMMPHTNKAKETNLVKNPLVIELTKATQTLNNLLRSLGLTAAQRKKVLKEGDSDELPDY